MSDFSEAGQNSLTPEQAAVLGVLADRQSLQKLGAAALNDLAERFEELAQNGDTPALFAFVVDVGRLALEQASPKSPNPLLEPSPSQEVIRIKPVLLPNQVIIPTRELFEDPEDAPVLLNVNHASVLKLLNRIYTETPDRKILRQLSDKRLGEMVCVLAAIRRFGRGYTDAQSDMTTTYMLQSVEGLTPLDIANEHERAYVTVTAGILRFVKSLQPHKILLDNLLIEAQKDEPLILPPDEEGRVSFRFDIDAYEEAVARPGVEDTTPATHLEPSLKKVLGVLNKIFVADEELLQSLDPKELFQVFDKVLTHYLANYDPLHSRVSWDERERIIRAYVSTLSNKKLQATLDRSASAANTYVRTFIHAVNHPKAKPLTLAEIMESLRTEGSMRLTGPVEELGRALDLSDKQIAGLLGVLYGEDDKSAKEPDEKTKEALALIRYASRRIRSQLGDIESLVLARFSGAPEQGRAPQSIAQIENDPQPAFRQALAASSKTVESLLRDSFARITEAARE